MSKHGRGRWSAVRHACNDPLKICSGTIPEGKVHEHDHGRRIQVLDSQAQGRTKVDEASRTTFDLAPSEIE